MVARKSHKQFNETMLPFSNVLYSYAYYLTGNSDDAADLLQETYLKAFRFYAKFEEGTNAKAWLYRIMRNTYINQYRRIKRLPDLITYDDQISSYQFSHQGRYNSADLRDQIEHRMLGDEVSTAISSLPEKFKSVVVLRDLEDMPYEEIAEALEIPIGTVRSRLHRARGILFNKLREYAKSGGYEVAQSYDVGGLVPAL